MRLDLTRAQIEAITAMLRDELEEDERLYLDMLEAETDLYEIVRKLLDEIEREEGIQAALATQIEDRLTRKERAARRVKINRGGIMALLECAKLDKLALPEATVSVRKVPPKPIVTDEAALPDEVCRFVRKPDMALIKASLESGHVMSGVTLDNGSVSLTVRRK